MVPTFCTIPSDTPGKTRVGEGDLEGPGEPKREDWSSSSEVIKSQVEM